MLAVYYAGAYSVAITCACDNVSAGRSGLLDLADGNAERQRISSLFLKKSATEWRK
jgi:hypothetical protein